MARWSVDRLASTSKGKGSARYGWGAHGSCFVVVSISVQMEEEA